MRRRPSRNLQSVKPALAAFSAALTVALGIFVAACTSSSTSPSAAVTSSGTTSSATSVTRPACAAWAGTLRAVGLPSPTGSQSTYRDALYAAGGGVKAVNAKAYAVWFPSNWASANPRRVIVGLHGTGGNAEEDWWFNWKSTTSDRGYAYIGLTYLDAATGSYDDEPAAYTNLKAALSDIGTSCDFGSPAIFLAGFSRGSAMTFGVSYLDLHDRRLFKGFVNNSGATPPGTPPTATVAGFMARNESSAYSGGHFWMYCGDLDNSHGSPMCDEMQTAKTLVTTYGGVVGDLYHDPPGGHGGLNSNASAVASMYAYLEGLR